jgi:hypothetical protein
MKIFPAHDLTSINSGVIARVQDADKKVWIAILYTCHPSEGGIDRLFLYPASDALHKSLFNT